MKLETLREIFNIGAGGAASALGKIMGERIMMSVPEVYHLGADEAAEKLGGLGPNAYALRTSISGPYAHSLVIFISEDSVRKIIDAGAKSLTPSVRKEQEESFLMELANIMSSHFTNNLAKLIGGRLLPGPPEMAVESPAKALKRYAEDSNTLHVELLLIKTDIYHKETQFSIHLIFFSDEELINKLLAKV